MRRWHLKAYTTSGGRSVVREWYDEQTAIVQAKFTTTMRFLLAAKRMDWKREPFALLKGQEDLGEIRFFKEKVQHRPIGFFGPTEGTFTILYHAIEKGGKLKPKECLSIARKRKTQVIHDPKHAVSCDWLWEDDEETSK